MTDITSILARCEALWRREAMAERTIHEMRSELESHLSDAVAAGKTPQAVVGQDIDGFARQWSAASQPTSLPVSMLATATSSSETAERARRSRARFVIASLLMVLATAAGFVFGGDATASDNIELWQWIFISSAFVLLVGELLTGGFFVLPFAFGSIAAGLLAFAGVSPIALLAVFTVVSMLGLWGLREFARKDDDTIANVGANRYVNRQAVVIESINGIASIGRVRLDAESWLAVTDHNERIESGTVVRVTEVRGARLVVTTG